MSLSLSLYTYVYMYIYIYIYIYIEALPVDAGALPQPGAEPWLLAAGQAAQAALNYDVYFDYICFNL